MSKLTVKELMELKGKRKIVQTTAFDYNTARACELGGVDMIVTWPAFCETMEELEVTLKQVRQGAPNILIGAGIPHAKAYISDGEAIRCAMAALKFGADIIYCSGMPPERMEALTKLRIPCVGHVGLVPFYRTWFGGLRAVGKDPKEAMDVYKNTLAYQEAGAIAVEMECVPEKIAAEITRNVDIIVFSMGSGPDCDGQYLFSCDLLGAHQGHYPRHSIKYCNFFEDSVNAFKRYKEDVVTGRFPQKDKVIEITDKNFEEFMKELNNLRIIPEE